MRCVLLCAGILLMLFAEGWARTAISDDRRRRERESRKKIMNGVLLTDSESEEEVEFEDEVKEAELIKEAMEEERLQGNRRTKRYIHLRAPLWEDGFVPYTFENLTDGQKETVSEAVNLIQDYTCVRFEFHEDKSTLDGNYLKFIDVPNSCFSSIGEKRPGQEISPCKQFPSVLHEILHALGFYHEQERFDRDRYVQVNMKNIKKAFRGNFQTPEYIREFLPSKFDLQSVMFYGAFHFSKKPGKKKTTDSLYDDVSMNRRDYWNVMKQLNEAYECPEINECVPIECANGGYQGFVVDECGCICPDFLDPQTDCQTFLPGVVGEVHYMDSSNQVVEFSTPEGRAQPDTVYTWMFFTEGKDSKIVVDITEMDVPGSERDCIAILWVNRDLVGQIGNGYCGDQFRPSIISVENTVILTLETYESTAVLKGTATFKTECTDEYGEMYEGSKDIAMSNKKCLPWSQAKKCEINPFNMFVFVDYKNNYCRNPEGMRSQPWCYTEISKNGCVMSLCDVCGHTRSYDTSADCEGRLDNDPSYCYSPEAETDCRKTCGFDAYFSAGTETPTSPTTPATSPTTTEEVHRSCDGDYSYFEGSCYKFETTRRTQKEAVDACKENGGELATVESMELQNFLVKLRKDAGAERKAFTVNAEWNDEGKKWNWNSNGATKDMEFTNWDAKKRLSRGNKKFSCAVVAGEKLNNAWRRIKCGQKNNYVCRKQTAP